MPVSRRRLLGVGAALSLAGLAALLPGTAVEADSPRPPLPDSVAQALRMLADLGFDDVVGVYRTLLPSIEIQPPNVLTSGGLTEWWSTSPAMSASISLRADLQGCPPTFCSYSGARAAPRLAVCVSPGRLWRLSGARGPGLPP